jgi:putative sterol carrier protein
MATVAEIQSLFDELPSKFRPEKADGVDSTIAFDLSGENGGTFWAKISNGTCETGTGSVENPAMTVSATADDFYKVAKGETNAMQAFMAGKLKIKGDMGLAMKMTGFFGF